MNNKGTGMMGKHPFSFVHEGVTYQYLLSLSKPAIAYSGRHGAKIELIKSICGSFVLVVNGRVFAAYDDSSDIEVPGYVSETMNLRDDVEIGLRAWQHQLRVYEAGPKPAGPAKK